MKALSTFLFLLAPMAFAQPSSHGGTTLKQVQVSNGSQIDLLFDGKVNKNQVHPEFFNDVIQISLTDVSVYPAKISSVTGGSLTKIFAYQYAPKLVRCRLTVKGKAEDFKEKLQIQANGRILTLRLDEAGTDRVSTQSAQAERVSDHSPAARNAPGAQAKAAAGRVGAVGNIDQAEEQALLERVLKNAPAPVAVAAEPPVAAKNANNGAEPQSAASAPAAPQKESASSRIARSERNERSEDRPLTSGKNLPSPLKAFGKLFIVLALFVGFMIGLRKLASGKLQAAPNNKIMGALSKFAQNNLGRKSKMIEMISTHHLGPKKSIAVVRIAGRMLVLGVTNDSINLITQLSGESELDLGDSEPLLGELMGAGATSAGPAIFADIFQSERVKPAKPQATPAPQARARTERPAASAQAVQPGQTAPNVMLGGAAGQYARAQAQMQGQIPSQMPSQISGQAYDPLRTLQSPVAPAMSTPSQVQSQATSQASVRAQIRSRLEGLKPL